MRFNYIFVQRSLSYFVGFCIPFYSITIPVLGKEMSLSILAMLFYFVTLFPLLSNFSGLKKIFGRLTLIPVYYYMFLTIVNCLNMGEVRTPIINVSLLSCFLLFYLFLIHVNYDVNSMKYCIWGMGFGGILLSLLAIQGIGVEIETSEMRLKVFDMNSNTVGIFLAISFIIILNNFIINDELHIKLLKYVFVGTFIPIITILLLTGSRTALFILSVSIVVTIVTYPSKSKRMKFLALSGGAILCVFGLNELLNSDNIMTARFIEFAENKDISGRDEIWGDYFSFFYDSPIWGYGDTGFAKISKIVFGVNELRGGYYYGVSPHNVIVELLLLTGIIGLSMWLLFWRKMFLCAIPPYKKYHNMTPLLLLIPLFFNIISGQLLLSTHGYIIYAYILSEYRKAIIKV